MIHKIKVKEFREINLENGFLIDGFPAIGFTSAIATESMIHTSQFELAGVIDSDSFPPVSLIKHGMPNYPTRIFVNDILKVGVFSSFLTLHESLHRDMAKTMLWWARRHKVSLIVSSVGVKSSNGVNEITAAASTPSARKKLEDAGFSVLQNGTIPGIPGVLLNEGMLNEQNVVVILYNSSGMGPDFRSSAELCMAMAKLVPGASCDIPSLQREAEIAERGIKEAEEESKPLKDAMYR